MLLTNSFYTTYTFAEQQVPCTVFFLNVLFILWSYTSQFMQIHETVFNLKKQNRKHTENNAIKAADELIKITAIIWLYSLE